MRARIADELEDLRQLFARTVAEGRGQRLDTLQALGTEAAVFRGEAAVFAGLADEVADPVTAFRAFAAAPRGTSSPRGKGFLMTTTPEDHAEPTPEPAANPAPKPIPTPAAAPPQAEAAPSPEAIRAEAAEVAQVCAQAARLGVAIDAADALTRGIKPEALRARVLPTSPPAAMPPASSPPPRRPGRRKAPSWRRRRSRPPRADRRPPSPQPETEPWPS